MAGMKFFLSFSPALELRRLSSSGVERCGLLDVPVDHVLGACCRSTVHFARSTQEQARNPPTNDASNRNPLGNERWGHRGPSFDKVTTAPRQMVRDASWTATVHDILSLATHRDRQIDRSELPLQLLNPKLFRVGGKFLSGGLDR